MAHSTRLCVWNIKAAKYSPFHRAIQREFKSNLSLFHTANEYWIMSEISVYMLVQPIGASPALSLARRHHRHLLINHITCCKSMLRLYCIFFYRSFTPFNAGKISKYTKEKHIQFFSWTSNTIPLEKSTHNWRCCCTHTFYVDICCFLFRAHHFSFPTLTTRSFSHEFMNIFIHTYNSLPSSSEHRRSRVCKASNNNVWYFFLGNFRTRCRPAKNSHCSERVSELPRGKCRKKHSEFFMGKYFSRLLFFLLCWWCAHCIA